MYKYETHLHTSEASACGSSSGAEYIDLYLELGYTGIIVTDHFFNGNCGVPKDLPWKERVERFCLGYEHAKEAGDRKGLQVMFGWESNYNNDEYLIYGLSPQWLLDHPEVMEWDQKQQFEEVSRYGGLVVQCHPFRVRDYVKDIRLHPYHAHAVEACNAGNPAWQDQLAYSYALKNRLVYTAGSDIHNISKAEEPQGLFGMQFTTPLTDISDYVQRIKSGTQQQLIAESCRLWSPMPLDNDSSEQLAKRPIILFDRNNHPSMANLCDVF